MESRGKFLVKLALQSMSMPNDSRSVTEFKKSLIDNKTISAINNDKKGNEDSSVEQQQYEKFLSMTSITSGLDYETRELALTNYNVEIMHPPALVEGNFTTELLLQDNQGLPATHHFLRDDGLQILLPEKNITEDTTTLVDGLVSNIEIEDTEDLTTSTNGIVSNIEVEDIVDPTTSTDGLASNNETNRFTKEGRIRKRKKFNTSVNERKENQLKKVRLAHLVKSHCGNCRKQCAINFSENQRLIINEQYWNMTWLQRRVFVLNNSTSASVHRRRSGEDSRRNKTFKYFFKSNTGERVQICKTFFLTTLGYCKSNDRLIQECLCKSKFDQILPKDDQRGKHTKTASVDREQLRLHVESFYPSVSHYRREHAPNKRYLPSDINIKMMYDDFKKKNSDLKCSYEVYRKFVSKDMNISFAKLGQEECETCEYFSLHDAGHTKDNLDVNCDICALWQRHIQKATEARSAYREDANKIYTANESAACFSVDMEKIIMLPRIEMFKKVIFCPRLIAFNECFVPVGKNQPNLKPIAIIWNESIAGRKKEDLVSTFYSFFLHMRDSLTIVLWLDNCAGQNKNWTLFSFLIFLINGKEIAANKIILKYFEPGHTFMSADSFHHQVELSLKRTPKVYDFTDFKNAVQSSNSGKVDVIEINKFYDWKDNSSVHKLQKTNPRPYLKDVVQVTARRGHNTLTYKTKFSCTEDFELNFLKAKEMKNGIPAPKRKTELRGITEERKNKIINTLSIVLPKNRMFFWENIPVNNDSASLIEDHDNN